ncbi:MULTISPECIES: hypothetical protein [unclassified Psychrobacter]|uniref:hypothetical protein n=1 Tax=unclassified Psychrobacter TaxID=196806 RepID=UPI0025DE82DC|nr:MULTISPECIES: hypothetical protein [unclassified Psychrobacter]
MESALIGLVGVLLGALIGEHFRRKNRIEIYSQRIFDKRLAVHEELYALFVGSSNVISEVMTNTELNEYDRTSLISSIIVPLCEFMDKNGFYINRYLTVQVATSYIGAENVLNHDNELDIISARLKVYETAKITRKMILEEARVSEIFKHFSTISKSKPDSDIIKRIKEIEGLRE